MLRNPKIVVLCGTLLVVVLGAIAWMMFALAPPADLDLSRDRTTAKGLYRVSIAPEAEPFDRTALHAWIATVKAPGGAPVDGARIAIDGGMPQHGHGLPTAPQMTAALGEGRYRIEGVRFNMSGWWEFKLRIDAAAGTDDVTFNLSL
jgi:hypothetical protein